MTVTPRVTPMSRPCHVLSCRHGRTDVTDVRTEVVNALLLLLLEMLRARGSSSSSEEST